VLASGGGGRGRLLGFIVEGLLQPTYVFFILLILLIIFGPGKLPDLGRGLGKGVREFEDAVRSGVEGTPEMRVEKAEDKKD
jgi:sec-independent protein translocase protein TatA